jgi:hypothetical protein
LILVSKTYWGQMPFWFRGRGPEGARVESLVLRTDDFRQIRANYWTSEREPKPKIGIVLMHPRVDFSHHYAVPRLVAAGFGVLAANSRHLNNDMMCEHEEVVLDLAACMKWMRAKAGVSKIALFGNSGGGSLSTYYHAQAKLPANARVERSPGGAPSGFAAAEMIPADALLLIAAHRGQGRVLLDTIDPSVTDEADPFATDASLDMYDTRNGFAEPPALSSYSADFLALYRAAQLDRVSRLDARARALIADHRAATDESESSGFLKRPFEERQRVMKRRAHEPVMTVYRTMANPKYTDPSLARSGREYGSLLSDRPDLMNMAALGFARVVTPRAWLSTWSALSSNADLVKNVAHVTEPLLVVHADRDREVYFDDDVKPVLEACPARDKTLVRLDARHYFEPDLGAKDAPDVERLMDVVVKWIRERLA